MAVILYNRDSEKNEAQMIKKIFIFAMTVILLLIILPLTAVAIRKTNRYELL